MIKPDFSAGFSGYRPDFPGAFAALGECTDQ